MDDITKRLMKLGGEIGTVANTHGVEGRGGAGGRLAVTILDAKDEIVKLRHALAWCGSSADFGLSGQAEKGWHKVCRPLLDFTNPGGGFVPDKNGDAMINEGVEIDE